MATGCDLPQADRLRADSGLAGAISVTERSRRREAKVLADRQRPREQPARNRRRWPTPSSGSRMPCSTSP